jgi:hypothetical protein
MKLRIKREKIEFGNLRKKLEITQTSKAKTEGDKKFNILKKKLAIAKSKLHAYKVTLKAAKQKDLFGVIYELKRKYDEAIKVLEIKLRRIKDANRKYRQDSEEAHSVKMNKLNKEYSAKFEAQKKEYKLKLATEKAKSKTVMKALKMKHATAINAAKVKTQIKIEKLMTQLKMIKEDNSSTERKLKTQISKFKDTESDYSKEISYNKKLVADKKKDLISWKKKTALRLKKDITQEDTDMKKSMGVIKLGKLKLKTKAMKEQAGLKAKLKVVLERIKSQKKTLKAEKKTYGKLMAEMKIWTSKQKTKLQTDVKAEVHKRKSHENKARETLKLCATKVKEERALILKLQGALENAIEKIKEIETKEMREMKLKEESARYEAKLNAIAIETAGYKKKMTEACEELSIDDSAQNMCEMAKADFAKAQAATDELARKFVEIKETYYSAS